MTHTKKIMVLSLLVSQALVLSMIERLIPVPVPIPGVKLGLANIISLFTIVTFGIKDTLIVLILRVLLASMFAGGVSGFLYSISGGMLSAFIMWIMYHYFYDKFSFISISIIGAISHNIAQLVIASIVIDDIRIFYYFPILVISAIITGILIGVTAKYTIKPIKTILNL